MKAENFPGTTRKVLNESLIQLTTEFLMRPAKRFRAQLVDIGCKLTAESETLTPEQIRRCEVASLVIEQLHAGALIIDDIQDGSLVRRNAPSLHLQYGLPRALNAGNWLYFEPLTRLKEMRLEVSQELALYRSCVETLADAHCGQALDLGIPIDQLEQSEVYTLSMKSLELKTGALTALAMRMGAYAAGSDPEKMDSLSELGCQIGVALQMFDDAGNFAMSFDNPMAQKRHEDLYLKRPSWVWAFAATHLDAGSYREWTAAVDRLPDEEKLKIFTEAHNFNLNLLREARANLNQIVARFGQLFPTRPQTVKLISNLAQNLEHAYV